jgi:molybdopterin molybdotransferase
VAVLATGSELRTPGESLGPGEIFESNRSLIGAALTAVGAEIELLPIVGDDDRAHREALRAGLVADILVTSGGVSVGPHDLVRRLADEIGIEKVFWGVAVKPGKPLFFGTRDRTLVFGLPGNPVSALVGTLVFVGPAVLRLQGAAEIGPAYEVGRAGARLERDAQRDQFIRARRRDEIEGTVLDAIVGQESHMIVRTAAANALVHVPRGTGAVAQNDFVHYIVLA